MMNSYGVVASPAVAIILGCGSIAQALHRIAGALETNSLK
jgi:hypothetical protein